MRKNRLIWQGAISCLVSIVLCVVCSCSNSSTETITSKEVDMDTISYFSLYSSPYPTLIAIDIADMNSNSVAEPLVFTQNWDDNTYVDILGKYNVKLHNEYQLDKRNEKYAVTVRHKISRTGGDGDATVENDPTVVIQTTQPITIYSPYVEECATVPYCYAEDLEVIWNEDPNNEYGVIILTRWTGLVINEQGTADPIYHASLVPDNGVAVLNNALFDDMPNNAYVTLFLIRANIVQITQGGSLVNLEDVDWSAIIGEYPELDCQATNVAIGTAAKLSFVLVTEL